jgi:hypothetical protein
MTQSIRIAFVPEHYLLPLHLASKQNAFPFPVQLIPFPSGTGHMITALRANEVDVAIGLTEGWVAGLLGGDGKGRGYRIVGSWVENPLRWAIVTGKDRSIGSVDDLGSLAKRDGLKVGVSRLGSGSHVMASVLARERGWEMGEQGMKPVVLGPFKELRDGVNDEKADFFMWEHFTTKKYWDGTDGERKEVKWVGEIYTPWPSWHVVVRERLAEEVVEGLFKGFDEGMRLFEEGGDGMVVKMLGSGEAHCHYGEEDAREWLKGVRFAKNTRGVSRKVMDGVVDVLKGAGVIKQDVGIMAGDGVLGIER